MQLVRWGCVVGNKVVGTVDGASTPPPELTTLVIQRLQQQTKHCTPMALSMASYEGKMGWSCYTDASLLQQRSGDNRQLPKGTKDQTKSRKEKPKLRPPPTLKVTNAKLLGPFLQSTGPLVHLWPTMHEDLTGENTRDTLVSSTLDVVLGPASQSPAWQTLVNSICQAQKVRPAGSPKASTDDLGAGPLQPDLYARMRPPPQPLDLSVSSFIEHTYGPLLRTCLRPGCKAVGVHFCQTCVAAWSCKFHFDEVRAHNSHCRPHALGSAQETKQQQQTHLRDAENAHVKKVSLHQRSPGDIVYTGKKRRRSSE
jgi:hypothetical protein